MRYSSQEAEQNLLGALILNNAPIIDLSLEPEDFSLWQHSEIFSDLRRIYTAKQRVGLSDFEVQGGEKTVEYLRLIAESVVSPVASNIRDWANTIRELSRKRKILEAVDAARLELDVKTSNEVIADIQSALTEGVSADRQKTTDKILSEIIADLSRPPVFYPTGLRHLDKGMAGGVYEGFTYGLCGAEKAGKTTFAHSISFNLPCKHLYVALEMGAKQIEQRNLARALGINSLEFLTPSPEMKNKLETVRKRQNTVYLDAPGAALEEIIHEIGIARIRHGIKGFIIDYWQLVQGQGRETEEKHLRTVAQSFADYARRHGLWCILLAQMNKEGDLFGGGGLRKACDQLYFIETPSLHPDARWLRMGASRYTPMTDIGSEGQPKFSLNKRVGPHFDDMYGT